MSVRIIPIDQQARGNFNGGQIIENKPIGFPSDGGFVRPFSTLFYWARAEAMVDSTIGLHPHQGFEIMSFVLEGSIKHYDTKNEEWLPLSAGDVQIIRAGNGIQHAEHMSKGAVIFQIWVDPDLSKTLQKPASYDDYKASEFEKSQIDGGEIIHIAGNEGKMNLDTRIDIRRIILKDSWSEGLSAGNIAAIYVIGGSGRINDQTVSQDDFVVLYGEDGLNVEVDESLDVFQINLPSEPGYRTYAERSMRHA